MQTTASELVEALRKAGKPLEITSHKKDGTFLLRHTLTLTTDKEGQPFTVFVKDDNGEKEYDVADFIKGFTRYLLFPIPTLDERLEKFSHLVPGSGAADTLEGEVVRAVQRVEYRYFNDGDEYDQGYGNETVSPSVDWLTHRSPIKSQVSSLFDDYRGNYEEKIETLKLAAVEWLESRKGETQPNGTEDSRSFKIAGKDYRDLSHEDDYEDDNWLDPDDIWPEYPDDEPVDDSDPHDYYGDN